ncbi:hypothetical protein CL6EHI_017900 [Entamoeba histolytica]|uniref:Uncharacterized protein n=2 Tax=Entamoeba histolytica TaxID=5759 RepID=C4MBJ9_ENTH1|nr:hypothetical protein EHI_017900 [Entamoeba histolytica HM-1:IMSS]EAL49713.1 hypothetical protein EHI_017900 [Entamoeba histolytica HM-1:IMSS]GAT99398.1 hypothetical protein CL6EHI_017900 [Entamoeba histolytica]|eukprot:XP_655100.1 hypothetical protein EHI_017900 [Entamoeba histolytica HM-1:IMSS]
MAKRIDKVTTTPKEISPAETKMKSTNTRRMYILAGCYYLVTKGWSFLISKEQRRAEKLHHFFPIQKIWNENKVIILDKEFEYEVVQEGKEAKLKFDTEGIPIKKEVTETSENPDKKKLVYNELVVMKIINECYLKYNELGSDNSLAHTKVSKNTISSQQYTKLPLVKKDGKCIGIFNKIEVLNTTGIQVYDFLCQYLKKEKSSEKEKDSQTKKEKDSQTKYESVFIGDKDCLNEKPYGNILLLSKEKFLDQAIDESKFKCLDNQVSSSSQQLNEDVEIQQPQSPTNISSSMEDNLLYNDIGSPLFEYQSTVANCSLLSVKISVALPANFREMLSQFECLSKNGVITQNNESESCVDMNRYENNEEYLQPDHLSDMGFKEYGFVQDMCH